MNAQAFKDELQKHAQPDKAVFLGHFFKTGPGQYGEGDQFLGVSVPSTRAVCKQFLPLSLGEVQQLLDSPIHEHRLGAVILLANQYAKQKDNRQAIYDFYLKNVRGGRVNNWDIVDSSAPHIVGHHLVGQSHDVLFELAGHNDIWRRRAAILASFWFIRLGDPTTTLRLAEQLLADSRDLIQKAVGWMLREVGKHCAVGVLTNFLDKHAAQMGRTALRYAIEHLTQEDKRYYMNVR